MKVDCEGCAGCCIDWRSLTDVDIDHEHRGRFQPLDETYNLVPLRRDEVRAFVDAGYGDVLQPRLFETRLTSETKSSKNATSGEREPVDGNEVRVDGVDVAAIHERPAFFIGLRKPPKPVGPFERDPTWLPTCTFLDPSTLQCRLHDDELYPETCKRYPGENLALDVETECERVERTVENGDSSAGGHRLLDDEPPADARPLFGPAALGTTVFAHPDPGRLTGIVTRLSDDEATRTDRAEFIAIAAASSPATLVINEPVYDRTREQVRDADSWAGRAIETWSERSDGVGTPTPEPTIAAAVENETDTPETPGWGHTDDYGGE